MDSQAGAGRSSEAEGSGHSEVLRINRPNKENTMAHNLTLKKGV